MRDIRLTGASLPYLPHRFVRPRFVQRGDDQRSAPCIGFGDGERTSVDLVEVGRTPSRHGFLEAEGFDRQPVHTASPAPPAYGRRPGFASPEQIELIRTLWREWIGPTAESEATVEAGLNTWLERYHGASSLRFVTTGAAGKVITALRAMKARKGAKRDASNG